MSDSLCCWTMRQSHWIFAEFPEYLPKQKDTFRKINENCKVPEMAEALEDSITSAYVSFCAFIARDFKCFCYCFSQTGLWYIAMKFDDEIYIYLQSTWPKSQLLSDCILFKWIMRKKHKALYKIDVGARVKCLFAEPALLPSEKQKTFKKTALNFM